jgi:hypothetical protein
MMGDSTQALKSSSKIWKYYRVCCKKPGERENKQEEKAARQRGAWGKWQTQGSWLQ